MKRLLVPSFLAATLAGCAVVEPYEAYPAAPYYGQPYAVAPPGYPLPPAYIGPPVGFSFGLGYWSGGHGGHHHGHHGHHGQGFRGHGFHHGAGGGFHH